MWRRVGEALWKTDGERGWFGWGVAVVSVSAVLLATTSETRPFWLLSLLVGLGMLPVRSGRRLERHPRRFVKWASPFPPYERLAVDLAGVRQSVLLYEVGHYTTARGRLRKAHLYSVVLAMEPQSLLVDTFINEHEARDFLFQLRDVLGISQLQDYCYDPPFEQQLGEPGLPAVAQVAESPDFEATVRETEELLEIEIPPGLPVELTAYHKGGPALVALMLAGTLTPYWPLFLTMALVMLFGCREYYWGRQARGLRESVRMTRSELELKSSWLGTRTIPLAALRALHLRKALAPGRRRRVETYFRWGNLLADGPECELLFGGRLSEEELRYLLYRIRRRLG